MMPSSTVQMEAGSAMSLFLNRAVKRKCSDAAAEAPSWEHDSSQKVRVVISGYRDGWYTVSSITMPSYSTETCPDIIASCSALLPKTHSDYKTRQRHCRA